MAEKEYRFVPQVGVARATSDLNVRQGAPATKSVPVARQVNAPTVLSYIGYVNDGEPVAGIAKWFVTPEGDFFWSGAVSTEGAIAVPNTARCLSKPLDMLICTQRFAERPAYYAQLGSPSGHNGMDFRTRQANGSWTVPVYAALDGTVVEATENTLNGKFVRINHANGFQTVYLHLSEMKVNQGDVVTTGKQIAISGNTGAASEAPHLHFGYRPIKFDQNNGFMGYIDPAPHFIDPIQYVT
jgi:murein DD-endopeptidase MepM/ murein hydrolase activator NlpD